MHPTIAVLRPLARRTVGQGLRITHPRQPRVQTRGFIALKDHLYFSKATAEGSGRNGFVRSNGDAPLDLKMAMPRAGGGKGDGQNPEQLLAMGYSSCFLGALQLAAARANKKELAENAKVTVNVFLGHPADPNVEGFGLRADITVEGCDDDEIIAAAHEFCPYSRALVYGAPVTIQKA